MNRVLHRVCIEKHVLAVLKEASDMYCMNRRYVFLHLSEFMGLNLSKGSRHSGERVRSLLSEEEKQALRLGFLRKGHIKSFLFPTVLLIIHESIDV